jgi:hypothetical protein
MIGLRQRPENNDLRIGRLIGGPCAYGICGLMAALNIVKMYKNNTL